MRLVSAPVGASYVGDSAASAAECSGACGGWRYAGGGEECRVFGNGRSGAVRCMRWQLVYVGHGRGRRGDDDGDPACGGQRGLEAVEGSLVQMASFTALAKPDQMSLVSVPGATVRVGAAASGLLQAKVVQADGVTPVPGVSVVFAATSAFGGKVSFGRCGGAQCTVLTGADGTASTTVTGVASGAVSLVASATVPTGVLTTSTTITVQADQTTLTTTNGTVYIAEGASTSLPLHGAGHGERKRVRAPAGALGGWRGDRACGHRCADRCERNGIRAGGAGSVGGRCSGVGEGVCVDDVCVPFYG